jgi:cell division protein FtsB
MKKEYQTFIVIGIILFILSDFAINNFFVDIILWVIAILLIYTSIRLSEETMSNDKKQKQKKEKQKKDKTYSKKKT